MATAPSLPPPNGSSTTNIPICKKEKPAQDGGTADTREIKRGEVIMIDIPRLLYPASLSCIPNFCSHCFRVLDQNSMYSCKFCKLAKFCSRRCQSYSHYVHICCALPALFNIQAALECETELLFLLCAYGLNTETLHELLSHRSNSSFKPDDALVETVHNQFLSLIRPNFIPSHFSRECTYHLLSIQKENSFPILNPRNERFKRIGKDGFRAYGIYSKASKLNHNCLPNTCVYNYIDDIGRQNNNFNLIIRAMHDIDAGSELCISYVPVNTIYRDRQRLLVERYGFQCKCMRCTAENQLKQKQEGKDGDDTGGTDDWGLKYSTSQAYLKTYICGCGGCLAPYPPSDDRSRLNVVECNTCGRVSENREEIAKYAPVRQAPKLTIRSASLS